MPPRTAPLLKASIIVFVLFGMFFTVDQALNSFMMRFDASSTGGPLQSPTRSPTRYRGKVPIVDRQKLAEIESHFLYKAALEGFTVWDPPDNPHSPPKITEIPEPTRKIILNDHRILPNEVADKSLCSDLFPCRLLLPTWIVEQESKASQHLYQISLLSQHLNRTLVLPNMWKSRFGTCNRNPFGYYYDTGFLTRSGVRVVTFEHFRDWVAERETSPAMQSFSIESEIAPIGAEAGQGIFLGQSGGPSSSKRRTCLERLVRLRDASQPPITVHPTRPRWHQDPSFRSEFTQGLINTLKTYHDIDIIALSWEVKHPIFPAAEPVYLQYTSKWVHLARSLSNKLSPFVAVHWRMETLNPKQLPTCASHLIELLISIKQHSIGENVDHRIQNVYLATDYPLKLNSRSLSGTFHTVTEDHHLAIQTLKNAFDIEGPLHDLTLTSFSEHGITHGITGSIDDQDFDSGLVGILDKAVAMNADYFVSGAPGCGRSSSFTAQIVQERRKNQNDLGLRNIVDRFGHHSS